MMATYLTETRSSSLYVNTNVSVHVSICWCH